MARPGPRFVTSIVNVAVPPALTVPPSGVFSTVTSGHLTTTLAVAWSVPSLVVVTLAVLLTVPQSAASVVPEMWTLKLAPAARLGLVQVEDLRPDRAGDGAVQAGGAAGRGARRPVDARGKRVVDRDVRGPCPCRCW